MTKPVAGMPPRSPLASYQPEEPLACGVAPLSGKEAAPSPPPVSQAPLPVEKVKMSQGALFCARMAGTPEGVGYSTGPREKRSSELSDAPAAGGAGKAPQPAKKGWLEQLQPGGQGAQSLWDSSQRAEYKSRITEMSRGYVAQIEVLSQQAELAIKERRPGDAAKFLDQARQIALRANQERNTIRTAIQEKMSPGGRAASRLIEQDRSWGALVEKYKAETGFDLYKTIAQKAGTSSFKATALASAGAVLSVGSLARGVQSAAKEIGEAPLEQKPGVALHHIAAMGGGAAGSTVGAVIAAGVVGAAGVTGFAGGLLVLAGSALGGVSGSTVAGDMVPGATEER